jgi:hypothetical protein
MENDYKGLNEYLNQEVEYPKAKQVIYCKSDFIEEAKEKFTDEDIEVRDIEEYMNEKRKKLEEHGFEY